MWEAVNENAIGSSCMRSLGFAVLLAVSLSATAQTEVARQPLRDEELAKQTYALQSLAIAPDSAAEIATLRQQFVAYYTAAGAERSSPRMRDALATLEWHTSNLTAPGFLLSDGSWSDINYKEAPSGSWGPWDHTRRLIILAKAYQTPGQSFHRNRTLLAQIDAALAYTKTFYGVTIYPSGNWWFWTIGIPIDLGPTLILMQGEVDQQVFNDLVFAIHFRIGSSATSKGLVGPTPTGQNLVWSAFTHLCLGLLKEDAAMLESVRGAMASVTLPTSGEGIKRDRSFHQHGAQLYTGGYGGSFANEVARYALIATGTRYSLPPASSESFSNYIADGVAWALYGNYFDVSTISREVARPSTTGYHGIAALLQASELPSPRTAEIRSAAAKMLQSWHGALPTEFAGLAARIEAAAYTPAWPSGNRHYFTSDYTIHRRPGWYASVKMFSTRTRSGERTNGENRFGSRQSDGRFYLVLAGNEYFGRDVWPTLDWSRLPGITVEQKADTANDTYGLGKNTFAGGTSDGQTGVSAMELMPLNSALTARKAWFYFEDSIAFLTNSITSSSANRVETIVNQWPLLSSASELVRNADWAVLENVGYWFPSQSSVDVTRQTRGGNWAALGASADTTEHSRAFVTLSLDHGVAPMNATAEYVIVPNIAPAAMASWAASRPLSVLANHQTVSAVRDNRTGRLGIVFWRAGALDGIQSSAAAVLLLSGDERAMRIDAADPNAGSSGTFQITIPGVWKTTDVVATNTTRSTTLTIPRASGETTSIFLTAPPPKRRAIR
jgi:chondroitin AC lyase